MSSDTMDMASDAETLADPSLDNPDKSLDNAVLRWNDAALQAVRSTHPGPPIVARALAITHTCMFDAWAAYDPHAIGTRLAGFLRRPTVEATTANKVEAISYAAHAALRDLFPSEATSFDALMTSLGYDPTSAGGDLTTPSGIGRTAAKAVLSFRHGDGANQSEDLAVGKYKDYTGYTPRNTPQNILDPDHWQPLFIPVTGVTQSYIAPHWGLVTPFALLSADQFHPIHGPATHTEPNYKTEVDAIIQTTASLTDRQKVIAEYWADGPSSELPPGHWCLFAQWVSRKHGHRLDTDVYLFFAMTNAVFDASIAGWDAKRRWDSVRPVTAVHFLYSGQQVPWWQPAGQAPRTVDGKDWQPYQAANVVTPPFPEFFSGHSVFSAAAAEVLQSFKGSDDFGASTRIAAHSSRVEVGQSPTADVILSWPTFSAAADEAGISRRYGGIHFKDGDLAGREAGRKIGAQAWLKAKSLFQPNEDVIA